MLVDKFLASRTASHLRPTLVRPPRGRQYSMMPFSQPISTASQSAPSTRQVQIRDRIAQMDSLSPVPTVAAKASLLDTLGRRHNYLRISLTERCNLRCFYCMPSEGVELSPSPSLLSDDEIIRLARLFVMNGVTKIRLTGGEPTIRKGIVELVARLNGLREYGLQSIGMTSNGLILHRHLPALVSNGLSHLNISLDTLDPFKFELMTRRMGHEAVLRSLHQALASPGLKSVKLNVVVIKGLNDSEVAGFVDMTKDQDLSVRFIEFMPFTGNKWDKSKMVPSAELLASVSSRYPDIIKAEDELNDTARSFRVPGYRGSIGFISSMSDHFCGSCNRLRLTADGQIKVCLFDAKEMSLRDRLRAGADDMALLKTIRVALHGKKEKHAVDGSLPSPRLHVPQPHLLLPWVSKTPPQPALTQIRSSSTRAAASSPTGLTHMDDQGRPSMVDVSDKDPSSRTAIASGRIYLPRAAFALVSPTFSVEAAHNNNTSTIQKAQEKARAKGDVLAVAQLAAIMGCKRTADLIPLCHPLPLTHISVTLTPEQTPGPSDISGSGMDGVYSVFCQATVRCEGRTGVETEALTAVSVGLLTVWDMLKAVAGREMSIGDIVVSRKAGGKSGDFIRRNIE